MDPTILWLLTLLPLGPAGAGEKGEPPDQAAAGGLAATLRLRGHLPEGPPPSPQVIRFQGGDALITRRIIEQVAETRRIAVTVNEMVPVQEEVVVKVDGRLEKRIQTSFRTIARQVERDVTVHRAVVRELAERISLKSVNAFVLSKEGKLDPLAGSRLPNLATKGALLVLLAESAAIDPLHLELIRPGTVILVSNGIPPDTP